MTVRFHFFDALGELGVDLVDSLAGELEAARDRATKKLPIQCVDVVVAPGSWVIPEYGLNGVAHSKSFIRITVDPASPRLKDVERGVRLLGVLAHELHHVARMRSPPWTDTLGGRLVSEGLAQCFEEEVGAPTPFYAISLDKTNLTNMAARARPLLETTDYDHVAWFFGRKGDPEWPRNTGYSLGYALVKAWLKLANLSASEAVAVPASEITEAWQTGQITVS